MASREYDVRWRVSFAADLMTGSLRFYDGEVVLRRGALRIALVDGRGVTVDARYLRESERIDIGDVISFPCHFAKIRDRLPATSTSAETAESSNRAGAVHGNNEEQTWYTEARMRCDTGRIFRPHTSMADARHVGSHLGVHSRPRACGAGINSPSRPLLDLDSALAHLWTAEKNPRSRSREDRGWWRGKVGGDSRSFAEVAASPPMASDAGRGIQGDRRQGADAAHAGRGMGRGAGRNAGRGNGRGGDKNKYSWKRSEGDGDGDCSASSNPTSAAADKTRWEAAATTRRQDGGIWVEKQQSTAASGDTGSGQTSSPARRPHGKQNINQVPPTKNPSSCIICKSNDHTPASRPQVFCERCNKLGHLASVCTAFAPWECIAPMCAFQSKGQGFYYIHDSCIASQLKERSNNIVVKIVEGETSTRQMELDLSDYPATGWRCSAHAIGPGVFVVRFPNPRAVAQICYVGKVTLKTSGAVIHATQWSSAVGSKGVMEVAWVRVINIPLDKRSERNVAFVASLVGIPLEIDKATLHRPASVRVKIGCRNVDTMPGIAESILGGHFYDFNYEVEQVLIRDPNRDRNEIRMPTSDDGGKNEKNSHTSNPGLQMGNASSGLGGKSSPIPQHVVPDPLRESQESVESDDSLHTSLLIDTLKYEHEQKLKEKVSTLTQQTRIKKKIEYKETVKSYSDVVKSLPRVVEVVGHHDSALKVVNEYRVESPENTEVIPTPPLISEENLRFSLRNVQSKMEHVEDKAAAVTKKRNMEGLMAGEDRESMERGAKMLRSNASTMMRICAPPSVTK